MTDPEEQARLGGEVQCEQCKKSIPLSEAHQPEGEDYVLYFCGLDCYESWRKRADHDADSVETE